MLLVILAVCIGVFVLGIYFQSGRHEDLGLGLSVCGGIFAVVVLIALLVMGICVSNLRTVDARIDMYQEENARIEEQISVAIKQYQEYETDIFTELEPESVVTLVSLYPELKADTLVQKQIEVYLNNNAAIKELKSEKIQGSVLRWWVYFGR